ncbi:MAG: Nif3-like dinuclear metal center hexameric protein [Bacillota bacterium]|nr:Nif3-like dinuclear metal center hexameric protein [Bacillota bacterium]
MRTIKEIYDFIDSFAPFNTAAKFDNCGFQIGNFETKVSRVLLSLDVTSNVISEAKEQGTQLIISHHPVLFSPTSCLYEQDIPYQLIKAGIASLSAHTNLDLTQNGGVNFELARVLQLENICFLDGEFIAYGILDEALNSEDFLNKVKQSLNCTALRYSGEPRKIKTVAVSSGSGGDSVYRAVEMNFDALVTGEAKYHEFLYASENNILLIDAGHFNTEDIVIEPLKNRLSKEFPDVTFTKSISGVNPIEIV